jgi:hypothetical protein
MSHQLKMVKRSFHGDDPVERPLLSFSFRKLNTKRYNQLSEIEKKEAVEFMNDCIRDLTIFRDGIK